MKVFSHIIPYLLLVSFFTPSIRDIDAEKVKSITESPYNGFAVPLVRNVDSGNYDLNLYIQDAQRVSTLTKKHIWPWIFFNRFIGSERDGHIDNGNKYFFDINGMDIYNTHGDLHEFYHLYEIALNISKAMGSPGIVVDPETYNNYKSLQVSYLVNKLHRSDEEIIARLREVGAKLADITHNVYPDATLWFLFTGLDRKQRSFNPFVKSQESTITLIIRGLLERARQKEMRIKVVSGGEQSLGYCFKSVDDVRETISRRRKDFASIQREYKILALGGTVAPWHDISLKRGYFKKNKCADSKFNELTDFDPVVEELFNSYEYVWIYAAISLGYNPYDKNVSERYAAMIKRVFWSIEKRHMPLSSKQVRTNGITR